MVTLNKTTLICIYEGTVVFLIQFRKANIKHPSESRFSQYCTFSTSSNACLTFRHFIFIVLSTNLASENAHSITFVL